VHNFRAIWNNIPAKWCGEELHSAKKWALFYTSKIGQLKDYE